MAKLSFEEKLYRKFGDRVFVKEKELDTGYAIVTDGDYDYRVKMAIQIGFSLRSPLAMTKESKLKRLTKECCDGIVATDIFVYKRNPTVVLTHVASGYSEMKNARIICIRGYSETVRKHAMKNKTFIERAKSKFGENITYEKTKYIGINYDITITCRKHGDVTLNADSFINDNFYGCPHCGKEKRKSGFRFGKTAFANKCKDNIGYLYCVYCYDDNESFYKIGITSKKNINERFSNISRFPYKFNVRRIVQAHPHIIYYVETILHRKYKSLKYIPKKNFKGSTECFNMQIVNREYDCLTIMDYIVSNAYKSKKFKYLQECDSK